MYKILGAETSHPIRQIILLINIDLALLNARHHYASVHHLLGNLRLLVDQLHRFDEPRQLKDHHLPCVVLRLQEDPSRHRVDPSLQLIVSIPHRHETLPTGTIHRHVGPYHRKKNLHQDVMLTNGTYQAELPSIMLGRVKRKKSSSRLDQIRGSKAHRLRHPIGIKGKFLYKSFLKCFFFFLI